MRRFVLFVCSVLIISVNSCKKNNDMQEPGNPASAHIKSMILTDSTGHDTIGLFFYQYDSQGRITKMTTQTSPVSVASVHNYVYYPTSIFDNISYGYNLHWGRIIYTLNPSGLAMAEMHVTYGLPGDSGVQLTVENKFDADGYRIEENSYLRSDTIRYSWMIAQGNCLSLEVWNSLHGSQPMAETYEHFPNTYNTLGNQNLGMMFMGKSDINLTKSSAVASTIPLSATYSYTFDTGNRVIKKSVRGNGLTVGSLNYLITYY
ncbi:MAG: hypothetical protein WCK09_18805 [Bacteroidota bacterium]